MEERMKDVVHVIRDQQGMRETTERGDIQRRMDEKSPDSPEGSRSRSKEAQLIPCGTDKESQR